MIVQQVVDIAREWVELNSGQYADFCGAYLFGGITSLPKDATFETYRDVDLIIFLESGPRSEDENLELSYMGIMQEVGFRGLDEHLNSEVALASPELAPDLASTTVLSDPIDILSSLHVYVAENYARRKWVLARCEVEKQQVRESLDAMSEATETLPRLISLWFVVRNLSGLLAIA